MIKNNYKYIYGPVPSWRLGSSLGIDPISEKKKICSFDCIYCQIGRGGIHTKVRKIFVPAVKIFEEIKALPEVDIDYITFSGRGEPTLAKNLGEMILGVKRIRKEPVAVITNASLLYKKEVREDLLCADFVIAKLDACSEDVFKKINRPVDGIDLKKVIEGIKKFSKETHGKLALQIMFVKENEKYAKEIAHLAGTFGADEIQINTPLRPCGIKPLTKKRMNEIEEYFKGLNPISVYKSERKKVEPVSKKDTLKRRGKV